MVRTTQGVGGDCTMQAPDSEVNGGNKRCHNFAFMLRCCQQPRLLLGGWYTLGVGGGNWGGEWGGGGT